MYKQYEPFTLPLGFQQPSTFVGNPGDKLRVRHELYDHVGTLGYDGLVYAGSRKSGKVTAVNIETFSAGKEIINEGHVGGRSVFEVIQTYDSMMDKSYCVISSNCEHTDNYARSLGWKSEQVDNLLYGIGAGLFLGAALYFATNKR